VIRAARKLAGQLQRFLPALIVSLTPLPALAQEVNDCDWRASAANIAEPWAENTRTFSNGKVRLALIDTTEPSASAIFLLILSPPLDATGKPQCRLIGRTQEQGYAWMGFERLNVSDDPARGLIIDLPAMIYLPEEGFSNSTRLTITLTPASGEITISQELGSE